MASVLAWSCTGSRQEPPEEAPIEVDIDPLHFRISAKHGQVERALAEVLKCSEQLGAELRDVVDPLLRLVCRQAPPELRESVLASGLNDVFPFEHVAEAQGASCGALRLRDRRTVLGRRMQEWSDAKDARAP